eukprot:3648100-Rhodomonas_salina.1
MPDRLHRAEQHLRRHRRVRAGLAHLLLPRDQRAVRLGPHALVHAAPRAPSQGQPRLHQPRSAAPHSTRAGLPLLQIRLRGGGRGLLALESPALAPPLGVGAPDPELALADPDGRAPAQLRPDRHFLVSPSLALLCLARARQTDSDPDGCAPCLGQVQAVDAEQARPAHAEPVVPAPQQHGRGSLGGRGGAERVCVGAGAVLGAEHRPRHPDPRAPACGLLLPLRNQRPRHQPVLLAPLASPWTPS